MKERLAEWLAERLVSFFQASALVLVGLSIVVPVSFVFFFAFNDVERGMIWQGFSLRWVLEIFQDRESMAALGNSFTVALSLTASSLLLGSAAVFGLLGVSAERRRLVTVVLLTGLITPDIALALSQARFFQVLHIPPGLFSVVAGQLPYATAYFAVFLLAISATHPIEKSIRAAVDLGATPFQVYRSVFLPLTRPAWLAASGFVFALSFQDFIYAFHLGGSGNSTLAVRIFSMLRRGISPGINMLFLLILLVVLGGLTLFYKTELKKGRTP